MACVLETDFSYLKTPCDKEQIYHIIIDKPDGHQEPTGGTAKCHYTARFTFFSFLWRLPLKKEEA